MSRLNRLLGCAAFAGSMALAASAEAQYYYPGAPYGYGYQQPGYVSPRVARKQRQLQRRNLENYGYAQPYGYGYAQPYGYGYGQPRARGYDYGYQRPYPGYRGPMTNGPQASPLRDP
jgi:hypothetical protein